MLRCCGVVVTLLAMNSCGRFEKKPTSLFTELSPSKTGIRFANALTYTHEVNPFSFHSFYNGGGVAVGDINNDGLQDVFFCGNQVANKLYLNKGNMQFEDISNKSILSSEGMWYTGATFADVNGDGWLDLFVCRAADFLVGWRGNQLFINNGDLTFTERTAEYRLTNTGFSTHAVFFDYDNDSDLDCYLLSNSNRSSTQYNPIKDQRKLYADKGGNKLYRNDGKFFTDVTQQAGIYSSMIGFGLGVTISDINKDGWQDIYISNDFFERDYLYLNNRDGTFNESLERYVREISLFSMGADIADINNDALPDIYVTDMLPEDEGRLKAKTNFESWERYQVNVQKGYYHQFLRNVLQLNRGPVQKDGETGFHFSEISRLAGVHASDWSWGALVADFDNDGWKDIFVSNGMYKDVTDQDFIQFVANDSVSLNRNDYKRLIDNLASQPLSNFAFHNNGDLTFTNKSVAWGLGEPGFSNGSVYVDLDNDGDLDLITNNINAPASVFRNNARELHPEHAYLKITLHGSAKNRQAFGTKVTAWTGGHVRYLEQMPARGFQSSVDNRLNLGLGAVSTIDSLIVEWPNGSVQKLRDVAVNQTLVLQQSQAASIASHQSGNNAKPMLLTPVATRAGITYQNVEKTVADFNRDRLLYHSVSSNGPRTAIADFNGDGRDDMLITGPGPQTAEMYEQQANASFVRIPTPWLDADQDLDDTSCAAFDADGDGDIDFFVTHAMAPSSLYINNGSAKFQKKLDASVASTGMSHASGVAPGDFDLDGDIDLAVSIRSIDGRYGFPGAVKILENNGNAEFTDITGKVAPSLEACGMATDVLWVDYDNDKRPDLVVGGEFMEIRLFRNTSDGFTESTQAAGLDKTQGWWNRLHVADVNRDGFPDIIAGNHGLNSRFKATESKPVTLYAGDFDKNGTAEHILCTFNGDKQYPMVLRHDLVSVVPSLKKKFLKYNDYKLKTINEIFTPDQLQGARKLDAFMLETSLFINDGQGRFVRQPLPVEAQFAPVYAIAAYDLDDDGQLEIVLGGNLYESRPEAGIYDGSYGLVLKQTKTGEFVALPIAESIYVEGCVRDIVRISSNKKDLLFMTRLGETVAVFETRATSPTLVGK